MHDQMAAACCPWLMPGQRADPQRLCAAGWSCSPSGDGLLAKFVCHPIVTPQLLSAGVKSQQGSRADGPTGATCEAEGRVLIRRAKGSHGRDSAAQIGFGIRTTSFSNVEPRKGWQLSGMGAELAAEKQRQTGMYPSCRTLLFCKRTRMMGRREPRPANPAAVVLAVQWRASSLLAAGRRRSAGPCITLHPLC